MRHFFNTAGPCNPDDHYMLSPEERLVGAQLHRYINDELYWTLHAPRQTGKTTFLLNLMREINEGGEAIACYVSVERCQGLVEVERAMPAICSSIRERALKSSLPIPEVNVVDASSMLSDILLNWSILDEKSIETVTLSHIEEAREKMIMARETHLDALAERLKEPRINAVVQPILVGDAVANLDPNHRDVMLAMDLGLIKWDTEQGFMIANPIYEDILTRTLNSVYFAQIPSPSTWRWQTANGRLDMDALFKEFQDFWRNNSDTWQRWTSYTHAFPHLLLMAFLQRVVNASGRVEREYAAGSGRMDLAVEYKGEWNIIEIKLLRKGQTFNWVKNQGLIQVNRYRSTFRPPTGYHKNITGVYLVIFDRRPKAQKAPWDERISWEMVGDVNVIGC